MRGKKQILLISDQRSFMVETLYRSLQEDGHVVESASPDKTSLMLQGEDADIILLYLGNYVFDSGEFLSLLNSYCQSENKQIIAVGDEEEMKALYKVVPRHLIELPLVRPVNIRNLIDRIRFMEMGGGAGTGKKNRKQLVLVDDDSTFLNMASEWLEQAGNYDVAILNSGAQVINYLAKRIPDLILLDYEMPVASGPQVLGMIRSDARFRDIPVFFLTGKNDRDSVMSVMSLKPDGYVIKTAGKQALLEKVNMFFSSRP